MGLVTTLFGNKLRRYFMGGIALLGATSSSSELASQPVPSAALQSWIADSRRKSQEGHFVAALSQRPDSIILNAAHRSHRSHASHYSSTGGHRSHYSHYSSYSTPQQPTQAPPRQTTPKETPSQTPESAKKLQQTKPTTIINRDPNNTESTQKPEQTPGTNINSNTAKNNKPNGQAIIESKTGSVKSIISSTVFILEDGTIVQLAGVKQKEPTNLLDSAGSRASAIAALNGWIYGKDVRVSLLDNKKAFVFVFPNAIECYCINLELIKQGVLIVDISSNTFAHDVLLQAEKEAKTKGIGVWSKETVKYEVEKDPFNK